MLLVGLNSAPLSSTLPLGDSFDSLQLLDVERIPKKKQEALAPVIEARSALLMDLDSGIHLYEKNAHQRLPIASLTKIMTAVIILESHSLHEVVMVEDDFSLIPELGVRIWLSQYEKLTVRSLLVALLVRSAGDAALALATYHSDSVEAFVEEMNRKADILHLKNTNFRNPIGLDEEGHYSTAFDLAILTKYALRNNTFRQIVRLPRATITSVDGKIKHEFDSTNYLLNSFLDIRGVKTGTTDEAGQSLISLARHLNGKEVISVILDSPERFQESKRLIDWSFRNYTW